MRDDQEVASSAFLLCEWENLVFPYLPSLSFVLFDTIESTLIFDSPQVDSYAITKWNVSMHVH